MKRTSRGDEFETVMERALEPGHFIKYGAGWDFVAGLRTVAARVGELVASDPERAARLYEIFLAGCWEKIEEVDDSSANLAMFVEDLFTDWIKARQAAGAAPDETAKWLLARMDDDPYGLASGLDCNAAKAMNRANLLAFARQVRSRFEGNPVGGGEPGSRNAGHARTRWAEVLRAIYVAQRDVASYVTLCEETSTSTQDCLAVATLLQARKPVDALGWVERGLALDRKNTRGSTADYQLTKLKRELLTKVGRGGDALEDAWAEFVRHPGKYTYEELLRFVPKAKRAEWHAKAMEAAEGTDLDSLLELWLETKEIDRIIGRLRSATDTELEGVSHYTTEPVAALLSMSHPDVAARVFRALGVRILESKKSKYYDAALRNFTDARACYERAGLPQAWDALVAEVRGEHRRKVAFIPDFERLVAGRVQGEELPFLERARRRWSSP